jgi:hypothetical protein
LSDGNPDYFGGSVNVFKICKMSEIIHSFTSQNLPYMDIERDQDFSQWSLLDFTACSETELHAWSQLCEPTNREEKIIELFQSQVALQEEMDGLRKQFEEMKNRCSEVFSSLLTNFMLISHFNSFPLSPFCFIVFVCFYVCVLFVHSY